MSCNDLHSFRIDINLNSNFAVNFDLPFIVFAFDRYIESVGILKLKIISLILHVVIVVLLVDSEWPLC